MSLDSIVSVTITVQDAAVSQAGFGTPLIMTHEAPFGPELVRSYTDTASMVVDGFSATGAAVLAATAVFAQQPSPSAVKVGIRESTPSAQTRVVTVATVKNSTVYTVTINGTAFTFTSDATATNLEIAAGLVAAVNGGSEPVTATDNIDGTFDLVADVAGTEFGLLVTKTLLTQDDTTTDAGVAADYAAIKVDDPDFYGVCMTSSATLEIAALAAAVEADSKIFAAQTSDADVLTDTAGNIAETLNTAAYQRTFLIWSGDNFDFANAAWLGNRLPSDPGSSTWKFKTLAGVAADSHTATELANMDANKCNHYTSVGGVNITREGTMAGGRFIDIQRGIDWLQARMQERVYSVLVNVEKIPFTNAGIAIVEKEIRAQLLEGVANGLLTDDFTVTVPLAENVSTPNKAARILPDMQFSATLAGAIHSIQIAGTVSV